MNRLLSVAPMMDCTDRHYRVFARGLSKHVLLYSEMLTTGAILHGDRDYLLGFDQIEHPVALQIGGSDPVACAEAAKVGEQFGYDEINLNVGCPSDRVQAGRFGACLMKEPQLVAECIAAMQRVVSIPVTVKTRLGVDDLDHYDHLCHFVETVKQVGCKTFILHARKAWLKGLSPKENREIPPLKYEWVYRLKREYPNLEILINGGIKTFEEIQQHLLQTDGVMVGRSAYSNPYLLAEFDRLYGATSQQPTRQEAVESYLPYMERQLAAGVRLRTLLRPLIGLFQGQSGGRRWRRYLSEHGGEQARGIDVVKTALSINQ